MKQYQMKMPQTVYAGEGALENIGSVAAGHQKAALFTDKAIRGSGLTARAEELLAAAGVTVSVLDELPAEPTCDQAQQVVEAFRRTGADLIAAIGGGSVMDIAKLASIAATDAYSVRDMLEAPLLGKKQVPTLLIPTTAGTGSEATPNSIVAVPEKELKVGIVNPAMLADYVILDGGMIRHLPRKIAAATGLDALAHAIECYTSNKANPFSDLFAMEALKLIFGNLMEACTNPDALEAKNKMLLAAFYGGAAITASGTTAVHALSYPLGGKYHIAHGVSNAMLLLPVMRFNAPACRREFGEIYRALSGIGLLPAGVDGAEAQTEAVLARMEEMIRMLDIPASLRSFGIGAEDLESLVAAGMDVQRLLQNNKRTVTADDARALYREIM